MDGVVLMVGVGILVLGFKVWLICLFNEEVDVLCMAFDFVLVVLLYLILLIIIVGF